MQMDSLYKRAYVYVKQMKRKRQINEPPTPEELSLLKEYEKTLDSLDKKPYIHYSLACLYLGDCGFPLDLKKAEYHSQQDPCGLPLLLQCYAMQQKYEELEDAAEKFLAKQTDREKIFAHAVFVFRTYCGWGMFGELPVSPSNYKKALKWRSIAEKYCPLDQIDLERFAEVFPEQSAVSSGESPDKSAGRSQSQKPFHFLAGVSDSPLNLFQKIFAWIKCFLLNVWYFFSNGCIL